MTQAVSSSGTLLKRGDGGGPETFTTIAEVLDISGPGMEAGTEEVTSHDSGGWREFIHTLLTMGEVTYDVNFFDDPTQDHETGLIDAWMTKSVDNYQIVFPTSPVLTVTFAALVTGVEMDAPVEGKLGASITLQSTGEPTFDH